MASKYTAAFVLAVSILWMVPRAQAVSDREAPPTAVETGRILMAQNRYDSAPGVPAQDRKVTDGAVEKQRPPDSRRGGEPRAERGAPADRNASDPSREKKPGLSIGKKGLKFLMPKITGYLPVPLGATTNGTKVFLTGKGFGTKKGEIRLFFGSGPPIKLSQVEWKSSSNVKGVVPNSAVGCGKDKVEFQVVTSGKLASNKWKTGWKQGGKQKTVQLKATDPVIKVVQCGKDANWNRCNMKGSKNYVEWTPTILDTSGTGCDLTKSICGWHKNQWGAVGDDKGIDKYQIKLKNNWKFTWANFKNKASSNDEKITGPSPVIPFGESEWSPSWKWLVTPGDDINYEAILKITGPEACPYH